MKRRKRRLLVIGLCLVALPLVAARAEAAPAVRPGRAAEAVPTETGGGRQFYFCAAFQAVKIVGLFTANAPLVLAGAIGGGLSCGFGW